MKNYTNYLKTVRNLFKGFFGRKLKVISTFNGIGAASVALKQLGVDVEMDTVCEIDTAANKTYFNNFPENEKSLVKDIIDLEKNIEVGKKVDILVQTPPCQSFSIQGKRKGLDSSNGNLFLTAINLQKKTDSNIVIYENVKGLVNHDKKLSSHQSLINKDYDGKKKTIGNTLHTIEKLLLEDKRYNYYWKVINSCDQGLPQNRERIFIVGIKKELDKGFTFPENRYLAFEVSDILEKEPANNVYYKNEAGHTLNSVHQTRRKNRIHTYAKYDETMTYESTRRVSYPYVSPCITTGNNCKFFIDKKVRVLTPTELKRVHGFNEEYKFVGTKTNIHRQLGNTVSPGVYVNLFASIFNYSKLSSCVNNVKYKTTEDFNKVIENKNSTSKIKRRVSRPTHNNHINISKKVSNISDSNYIYLTQEMFNDYSSHLLNGGTITVTLEVYKKDKNTGNKKVKKLECKKIITVDSLELLGLTNKAYGYHRVKVSGQTNDVNEVAKNHVLVMRPGGKGKFESQFEKVHNHLGLNDTCVDTVIDGFFGGGGYTLKNIEKLKFKRYIINDLDSLIIKTMEAVKKNPSKVIEKFVKINDKFQSLIPNELRKYKKTTKKRIDPVLQDLRQKHMYIKDYYRDISKVLDKYKTFDIYEISAYYIFFNMKTTNGFFKYNEDGTIKDTSFNHKYTLNDKTHMINYWSYLLNHYNVEIRNEDIFDLLKDKSIKKEDSLVYLDPPYLGVDYIYDRDNGEDFQITLLNASDEFKYRIYSNENCEELYELNIPNRFPYILNFDRNNKMGQPSKSNGGLEFLGCNTKEDLVSTRTINNQNYIPTEIKKEIVS